MSRHRSGIARNLALVPCLLPGLVLAWAAVGCDRTPSTSDASEDAPEAMADSTAAEWVDGETADGTWRVWWRPVGGPIPSLEPFSVEVRLRDPAGGPVPEHVTVLVDATMPHHGHGMNVEPRIQRIGDGLYLAEGMLMHMPGRWEFTVDVLGGGPEEAEVERAQWTVMLDD